jgi:hypothetical protein
MLNCLADKILAREAPTERGGDVNEQRPNSEGNEPLADAGYDTDESNGAAATVVTSYRPSPADGEDLGPPSLDPNQPPRSLKAQVRNRPAWRDPARKKKIHIIAFFVYYR